MKNLKFYLASIIILLVIVSFACLNEKEKNYINIGVILPLTGEPAVWGVSMKRGIDLAASQLNSNGGVNEKEIKLIYEDDKGMQNSGIAAIKKLISVDKVKIILGVANSSVAKAIIPVIDDYNSKNKEKIIFISGGASSPELTGISPYFFRTWPSDNEETKEMATFLNSNDKYKNIAILYMNNDYGVDLMQSFKDKLKELEINVLVNESFSEEDVDVRSQLSKIKVVEPDAVYLVGNPKGMARALVQAKELGLNTQFLSTSAIIEPEVMKIAGNAVEGVLYTDASIDTSDENIMIKEFMTDFKNRYNQDPGMLAFTGYDSMMVVASAIENKGEDSESIKSYLDDLENFSSLGGNISFDQGSVIRPVRIGIIRNGKFEVYRKKN